MKTPLATRAFLALSGVIAIGIGGALLFVPAAFQSSAGITLGDDVNLLSETRAPGGLLFAAGVLIFMGAFAKTMMRTSLVISILVYLSYGIARVLSMIIDGIPHESLVAATGGEIVIGLLGLFLLYRFAKIQSAA